MKRIIHLIFLLGLLIGCETGNDEDTPEVLLTEIKVSFDDPIVQKILDHQDRLETDSLLRFFSHRNPTYRYLAAKAFASVNKPSIIDTLATLLFDPISEVQQAAAYALGQQGRTEAEHHLVSAFQNNDSLNVNNPLNATILEAIGKCGSINTLALMSQVTTYQPEDHHLLYGQARAIYRFMLRQVVHPDGTQRMINLLANNNHDRKIRQTAANYLSRADLDLHEHQELITLICENEKDARIKLWLPQALVKCSSVREAEILRAYLADDQDYRVRCNAIRAMAQTDYDLYRRDIHRRLYDQNPHVARVAATSIVDHGKSRYWREYMNLSLGDFRWPIKINLLHAVNKYIPGGNAMFREINDQKLQQRIRNSNSEYEQAAAILALAENPYWHQYIINLFDNANSSVIKAACLGGLIHIAEKPSFNRLRLDHRKTIINEILLALQSGDVGSVELASRAFGITHLDWNSYEVASPTEVLNAALDKLELPRDMEAHIALQKILSELNGSNYDHIKDLVHTHRIDWSILASIHDTTRVQIMTTKGTITVQLLPDLSPATVANFVDLSRLNYFAAKSFHRVVPVFVIQGGCNRGDGYGSMDYNIRSELAQSYYDESGYVGMASAGRHTESAQWFITHTATPHLDGRYTIFGKVINGMEVVHQIEVGDQIEQVTFR